MIVLWKAIALIWLLALAAITVEAAKVQPQKDPRNQANPYVRRQEKKKDDFIHAQVEERTRKDLGLDTISKQNRAILIGDGTCIPQKRYAREPDYYFAVFNPAKTDYPSGVTKFKPETHIDCFFTGQLTTKPDKILDSASKTSKTLKFSMSTSPFIDGDNVFCLSPAFEDYRGEVSVSIRWNMVDLESERDTTHERSIRGVLDNAIIYYEGENENGIDVDGETIPAVMRISDFLISENEVTLKPIDKVVFFYGDNREVLLNSFSKVLDSFKAASDKVEANFEMMAAFDLSSDTVSSSLNLATCEFRCLCKDSTCPSDAAFVSAYPLTLSGASASGVKYMKCSSRRLLDCSGNSLPGKIVVAISYPTVFGSRTLEQKTADLEFVVKRKVVKQKEGSNGQWTTSSPYILNRALKAVRAKAQPQPEDSDMEFTLFGGTSSATLNLRRNAFYSNSAAQSGPKTVRIGSFNVELPASAFLKFLDKWRIIFDTSDPNEKRVVDTSPGAIFADIVGDHDILGIVESGFPSTDEKGSNLKPDSLMRRPNRENIIPLEVGTESRQKNNQGISSVLRDFHEALEIRDVKAKEMGIALPRKSPRKSLGVSYSTNSRVDGVMMFWNPEAFNDPICLLFDQVEFQFTYPPYICLWQNAQNGQTLITITVHITFPDYKKEDESLTQQCAATAGDPQSDTSQPTEKVRRAQNEICIGLAAAIEFAVEVFCPQKTSSLCPPILTMGDFNIDAFNKKDIYHPSVRTEATGCIDLKGNILKKDSTATVFRNDMATQNGTTIFFLDSIISQYPEYLKSKKDRDAKIQDRLLIEQGKKPRPEKLARIPPEKTMISLIRDSVNQHDRIYSYNTERALKNVQGFVLPVLSGENADKTDSATTGNPVKKFPAELENTRQIWDYIVRRKEKFVLTRSDTCLVEETFCQSNAGKGWKTLVSDHFPVYADILL